MAYRGPWIKGEDASDESVTWAARRNSVSSQSSKAANSVSDREVESDKADDWDTSNKLSTVGLGMAGARVKPSALPCLTPCL